MCFSFPITKILLVFYEDAPPDSRYGQLAPSSSPTRDRSTRRYATNSVTCIPVAGAVMLRHCFPKDSLFGGREPEKAIQSISTFSLGRKCGPSNLARSSRV